jgi:2,3-bisphosphoglycerate-independent phosphoglycerate mutase
VSPIVLVLLDGLGDQPHEALGGRTSKEVARTPHLDGLAAESSSGLVSPVGRGGAPSSEVAHWTYSTGSLASLPGRAVLEAMGHGRPPDERVTGYLALRAGRRADDGGVWLGARPGRADEEEARALLGALPIGPFSDITFDVRPVPGGDAIVALDGPAHPDLGDTDSFEDDLHPLLRCEALAAEPAAASTAAAVSAWTVACHEVLRDHPVNRRRVARGVDPFDVATTKWWGRARRVVPYAERTGLRAAIVSEAAYQGGMAELLGMAWVRPPRCAPGRESLEARLRLVRDLLDDGYDVVHCHDKTADEAGHTKDPLCKVAAVESLDAALVGLPPAEDDDVVVVVTGDHATPSGGRMLHSGDPAPLLLRGRRVAADAVRRFGERHQAAGALGHLHGADILPIAVNAADREVPRRARRSRLPPRHRRSLGRSPAAGASGMSAVDGAPLCPPRPPGGSGLLPRNGPAFEALDLLGPVRGDGRGPRGVLTEGHQRGGRRRDRGAVALPDLVLDDEARATQPRDPRAAAQEVAVVGLGAEVALQPDQHVGQLVMRAEIQVHDVVHPARLEQLEDGEVVQVAHRVEVGEADSELRHMPIAVPLLHARPSDPVSWLTGDMLPAPCHELGGPGGAS